MFTSDFFVRPEKKKVSKCKKKNNGLGVTTWRTEPNHVMSMSVITLTQHQPRTQGLRSSWPAVRKTKDQAKFRFEVQLNCACIVFKCMTNQLLGTLLPVIFIVFQTKQYQSCNGTFESHSSRQACAVRNEDSGYKIGEALVLAYFFSEENEHKFFHQMWAEKEMQLFTY